MKDAWCDLLLKPFLGCFMQKNNTKHYFRNVTINIQERKWISKLCTNTLQELLIKTVVQVNLDMTNHCTTEFAYDGPIFLVPLSPSYPSSPVVVDVTKEFLGYSFTERIEKENLIQTFFEGF